MMNAITLSAGTGFHPIRAAGVKIHDAIHAVDEYTKPRPHTHGNLTSPSLFQAAFNGASDGFYIFGPVGILTGGTSAALGIAVQKATHSQVLGVATGMVAGAVLGGVTASLMGSPIGATMGALNGALVGAFETLRGHSESSMRDCANGSMLSAFFVNGPVKMVGGLAGMVASDAKTTRGKVLVGAVVGASMGAALALIGMAPVGVVTAAVVSGAAGAIGPFFGPRFSQFFRNLAEDTGKLVGRAVPEKARQAVGTVPASFAKESLRAFLYSDGSFSSLLVGGVKESIRQIHILLKSRADAKTGTAQPAPSASPTASSPGATQPAA